ncbi:SMP-30/gluconolactonase/LRE family protein [Novosphingobium sp. JCM 18896]|uniref:SMP-30/gluconolactonase/LRE family protein n=1 Tax=Novosphingobium sp. JCM 18896 TaxID=2989731 RepID=UPI002223D0A7|nr:SMP-30/gluconolactonase/LRE family protein [Novosphingobium sp. JCM 18896]MCW1427501.1 SMP-30/gluconolactonase/LRE family protein [Novosphingobium sp. JCM 18896]
MTQTTPRYVSPNPAETAEGWTLERVTRPSRLFGANGLHTGKDGRVYVASVGGSQVSAIDVDTLEIEAYAPMGGPITGPDDLAFDDAGNLYVTEITENQVRVLRPNGTSDVIADLRVANPIIFKQNRLIAGELTMGARIVELDRNGGAPRTIIEGVPMANAFDIGPDGKLYFPAQAANEIWRVSLDGGEPEVVTKDLGVPDSVKFHPDGYIVSTQVYSGQVLKIDPRTGEKEVLADVGPGLDNVAFVNGRTFVSHITGSIHEITPGKAKPLVKKGMQWPLGLAVAESGELFIADGGFTYTLQAGGEPELAGMLFSPGFPGWVRDVAAAGAGEWIVTTANGDVARFNPAGQASEMLAQGYDRLMGVDLAASGAVVFAEMPTGRLLSVERGEVSELARGLDKPMGVAIGPDGAVYVAEAGAGRVTKVAGGKTETVIDGLGTPEGLAIAGGKLYVVDTDSKQVIESDLAGGNRRAIGANLPVGAPAGIVPKELGSVGDMCGPMTTFAGLAAGGDGTIYVAGAAEGSVLALRPA